MAKYIKATEVGAFARKKCVGITNVKAATILDVSRQHLEFIYANKMQPSYKLQKALGLEAVYQVIETGRYISLEELAAYLKKLQGDASVSEFCKTKGLSRTNYYQFIKGLQDPKRRVLNSIGLEPYYKIVDASPLAKPNPVPVPVDPLTRIRQLERENRALKQELKKKTKDEPAE